MAIVVGFKNNKPVYAKDFWTDEKLSELLDKYRLTESKK